MFLFDFYNWRLYKTVTFPFNYYLYDKQEECWFRLHTIWRYPICNKCTAGLTWEMVCRADDHCKLHGTHLIGFISLCFFILFYFWIFTIDEPFSLTRDVLNTVYAGRCPSHTRKDSQTADKFLGSIIKYSHDCSRNMHPQNYTA